MRRRGLLQDAVVWCSGKQEGGVLLSACQGGDGECGGEEMWRRGLLQDAVVWCSGKQESGLLLSACQGGNGECGTQEVWPPGLPYALIVCKKAEFCSQHARAGMVDVVNKKCNDDGCSKTPSFCLAGGKNVKFCARYARAGMVDVVTKKCDHEGCSKKPSYDVAGSKTAKFCSQHARAGMVHVVRYKSSREGCLKLDILKDDNRDKAKLCRQHPTAHEAATVYDTGELSTGEATSTRSIIEGGGGSVAGVRGTKRKRAPYLSSGTSDVVDARRSVSPVARRIGVTPLLLSGQLPSGANRHVSSVPRVGAGVKVEAAAPSSTHDGAGIGQCSKHTAPSRDWSSA
ncbi:unnamed protein product, partial [Sphacelaria rigidula]